MAGKIGICRQYRHIGLFVQWQSELNQNFGNTLKIWLTFDLVPNFDNTLRNLAMPNFFFTFLGFLSGGQNYCQFYGLAVSTCNDRWHMVVG